MIDFHYWPTPNGWKVSIMLEECGLDYRTRYVNIGRGEQHSRAFLALSPNGRMPAIVDDDPDPAYGPDPVSTFESGAIPALPGREDRPVPARRRAREKGDARVGCSGRSAVSGPWPASSATSSTTPRRIWTTPTRTGATPTSTTGCWACWSGAWRIASFLVGDYSIADMAAWPWVLIAKAARPGAGCRRGRVPERRALAPRGQGAPRGVRAGVDLGKDRRRAAPPDEAERRVLFGRRAGATDRSPAGPRHERHARQHARHADGLEPPARDLTACQLPERPRRGARARREAQRRARRARRPAAARRR